MEKKKQCPIPGDSGDNKVFLVKIWKFQQPAHELLE